MVKKEFIMEITAGMRIKKANENIKTLLTSFLFSGADFFSNFIEKIPDKKTMSEEFNAEYS
jgi:hypothetical protein